MKKYFLAAAILFFLLSVAGAVQGAVSATAKQTAKPKIQSYEGVITQFNAGDGNFVMRLRDGRSVTVNNPFSVGAFVSVNGVLDPKANLIPDISQITFKNLSAADAIPVLLELNPGSGMIGTQVTLRGSGFTKKGNAVNFGGVQNAIPNIPSPDGKTLTFTIPARACPGGVQKGCTQPILKRGNADYEISVSNANGVSNTTKFDLFDTPPLRILTTALPQAVQQQYNTTLDALGGLESYVWMITSGSLPPGLKLVQSVCIASPCKVPATLRGTPTIPGSYIFTITLTSGTEIVSQEFTIVVVPTLSTPQ